MRRTKRRRDGERGSMLAQTMVFVVLLALIASQVLHLAYGRRVLVQRVNSSEAGRQRLLGVESHVHACLEGTAFGRTTCVFPVGPGCPLDSIDGKAVTILTSGTAPDCAIKITIAD
jgi:hypothetical protein